MTGNRPAQLDRLDTPIVGSWQVVGRTRAGQPVDLTAFRGLPLQLGPFSTTDPFGDKQLTFTVPAVTPFESFDMASYQRGRNNVPAFTSSDLAWCWDGALVSLRWHGPLPASYPYGSPVLDKHKAGPKLTGWTPGFAWQGLVTTAEFDTDNGLSVTLKGLNYQLDQWQAKPEYVRRPFPYEHAIARQFADKPALRVKALQVLWPDSWSKTYTHPGKKTPSYRIPAGVRPGAWWTGLLTRETGRWEAVLTSYIQTLLQGMYTSHGRWTFDLLPGRQPVLLHRDMRLLPRSDTVVMDPIAVGNKLSLTVDWSQKIDVAYAQGVSLDGVAYSGMQVSEDGLETWYEPAAYSRRAWPIEDNPWLDPSANPNEVMLQMQSGLDEGQAMMVARDHQRRFAEPGVTGSVTLGVDPKMGGEWLPRFLVRAGMTLHIPGVFGRPEGMLFHVTDTSADMASDTMTLTVDSKFRDALTVAEVRKRGRDALAVPRALLAGQYQPPIADQLVPWSYAKGSGFIPSGGRRSCLPLFDGMPEETAFPWTTWTTQRPPSNKRWRSSYIRVGPVDANADNNWAYRGGGPISGRFGITIRAAQAATIRLLQIAAYKADGTVMKVPFHVSFYWSNGVNVLSMPAVLPSDVSSGHAGGYSAGQHYPFAISSWEKYNADGTLVQPNIPLPTDSAGLIRAYGTYFQKAGFFPGSDPGPGSDAGATGLLVDESTWSIDTTQTKQQFDPYSPKGNKKNPFAGRIYVMIYCDAQDSNPVYFAGRLFRVEPGTAGT